MIQAAIFDMDGLLIDSERVTYEVMSEQIEEAGGMLPKEFYVTLLGRSDLDAGRRLRERYGEDFDIASFMAEGHRRMARRYEVQGVPVKTGAEQLLRQLHADGIPCAVASSSDHDWVLKLMRSAGLDKYFSAYVCGDDVTRAKPDPEIFLTACRKLGVKPENALIFEDAETGIRAADAAGIPVICIPDLKQPAAEIAEKAHKLLPSLAAAADYLKENRYEI